MKKIVALTVLLSVTTPAFCMMNFFNCLKKQDKEDDKKIFKLYTEKIKNTKPVSIDSIKKLYTEEIYNTKPVSIDQINETEKLEQYFRDHKFEFVPVETFEQFKKNYNKKKAQQNSFFRNIWETCKDMINENSLGRLHPENKSKVDRGCNAMKDLLKFVLKLPEGIYEFNKELIGFDDHVATIIRNNKKPPYPSDRSGFPVPFMIRNGAGHWQ